MISPLLANIYLHPMDILVTSSGYKIVRYADDAVVLCQTRKEAEQALSLFQTWIEVNGLRLNLDKTHLSDYMQIGQGFEFLGYWFERGYRRIRPKSLGALKDKIRQRTR